MTDRQVEFPGHKAGRSERYRLRAVAGRIMGKGHRVYTCGRKVVGNHVTVKKTADGAFLTGIERCGSVWACPVCAAKVAEGRRAEVEDLLSLHQAAGGAVYMVAFTLRHDRFDKVDELRAGVAGAWRRMGQGRAWLALKETYGVVGTIRALEVTHGEANGWHPHLHVLIATSAALNEVDEAALSATLFQRWAAIVAAQGLGECDRGAFSFEKCRNVSAAGDYVTKWGTAAEITKGQAKEARGGSRSPFQLLADAADRARPDPRAFMLFRDYCTSFKGARQLTWSKGFRAMYGRAEEAADEEIAAADPRVSEMVIILPAPVYREYIRQRSHAADIVTAAELGGAAAVIAHLQKQGIVWNGEAGPSPPYGGGNVSRTEGCASGGVSFAVAAAQGEDGVVADL